MESKFKLFVIIAIVVLGISIAASTFFVLKQMNESSNGQTAATEKELNLTEVSMGDAIMTNIAIGEDAVQHFAKIKLA